ncbi:hypothetical protein [Propionimicrobium sp. PCR01-08-3]|uniref:hypothetical protein n=1 Tax=Propionimicrobium sp. PCR01-08-3 TaxID=3052086 RepID=UPI00255CC744|nr:hypothetical protein [Propionimicrobium sp. PCR01-08-3]WIY82360.1 hypothetical protein QQ658_12765 [Propionimicrobium sp. PCR01-08-3]
MSTDTPQHSPFTRPGFIAAALVIALIVVAGVIVGITRNKPEPEAPPATTAATTGESTTASEPSICGLDGEVLTGTLTTAPETTWQYQDIDAYPTSPKYGPADTRDGYRMCYQHTPEGALFSAANAGIQGSMAATDFEAYLAWMNYFVSVDCPIRDQLLDQAAAGTDSDPAAQLRIEGFRLLSYNAGDARVDLAFSSMVDGRTVYMSGVYDLVWENGDWKMSPTDSVNPLRLAQIPDLAGYVDWGE